MKKIRPMLEWKLLVWSIISTFMLGTQLFAQGTRRITGRILNTNSLPVQGATVSVKGTNSATQTSSTGSFAISAKTGDVLVVSSVGYETKEAAVGTGSTVNFALG